jgi:hypothetical protein
MYCKERDLKNDGLASVGINSGVFDHKINFLPIWHFGSPHSGACQSTIHSRAAAQKQSSSISTRASRERGHTLSIPHIFQLGSCGKKDAARVCVSLYDEHTQSEKVVAGVNNRLRAVSLSREASERAPASRSRSES